MYRREALHRFTAVSVAATLAGCGSGASSRRDAPRPPEAPEGGPSGGPDVPDGSLTVAGIDYRADDSGHLVVVVTIENGGGESQSGTLTTTITLSGEMLTESTDVTVEADDSTEVEVPFEALFDDFEQDGSIDLELG